MASRSTSRSAPASRACSSSNGWRLTPPEPPARGGFVLTRRDFARYRKPQGEALMADILEYCQGLEQDTFKPGAAILTEGERFGRLYVLVEGQVEVIREHTQVTQVDEPGSIFGEMAVLLDMPHSATVKALSAVTAYEIPDALTFLDSRPEFSLHIATMLARR